ncbi:MAG: efflux RND transporter periplasmic adaptor subunit [bacterium]
MKKLIIILVILAVIAAMVFGAIYMRRKASGVTQVTTETVQRRDILQVVTAFGSLNPQVEVAISSKVIGQIERLYVEEGDTVARGDTLVELERNRYRAAVSSAQAALRSARSDVSRVQANLNQAKETLRRSQAMFDKNLISEDALLQAQTQVEVQEAMLESAKNNVDRAQGTLEETQDDLDQTTIIAPASGVVISLSVEEGENVITGTMNNPGSVIMTIAQLDAMEAVVDVDEADVVSLDIGQKVKVEVDAFADTFLVGEVVKIANSAKLQSVGGQETVANYEVKISVPEPFEGIRPGMSCTAEIEVEKAESVLSVPIQSIVTAREEPGKESEEKPSSRNGMMRKKDAVFVVKNGAAHQRIVETGIADDRYIEIKEGIEENDKVVTGRYEALRALQDGDHVEEISSGFQGPGRGGFGGRPN